MYINELTEGDEFQGSLLVTEKDKKLTKNNQQFLDLYLSDSTGTIDAKVWNSSDYMAKTLEVGSVINVIRGQITSFQNQLQIKLIEFKMDTDKNPYEFMPQAPESRDYLMEYVFNAIEEIDNYVLYTVTKSIFKEHANDFELYPAASRMHHNYVSGLAYHTVSMLKVASSMLDTYSFLNGDLLRAGIILHDVQKCGEYTGLINTEKTMEGKMKGHISMISEEVWSVAKELGFEESEEVTILQNLLLSHHGNVEQGFGSAVSPLTAEAQMAHFIDMIDAKMEMVRVNLNETEHGNFTNKIAGLDNRSFYNHDLE